MLTRRRKRREIVDDDDDLFSMLHAYRSFNHWIRVLLELAKQLLLSRVYYNSI
jgi:hypothetical protein